MWLRYTHIQLGQLECLHSEDSPRHLMITHTTELYWIPSQKKIKVKVKNFKNLPKFQIFEFWNKHYTQHTFWSCLIRKGSDEYCWRYRADTILSTDGQTDGRMDRRTDGQSETSIPPFQLRWSGGYDKFRVNSEVSLPVNSQKPPILAILSKFGPPRVGAKIGPE